MSVKINLALDLTIFTTFLVAGATYLILNDSSSSGMEAGERPSFDSSNAPADFSGEIPDRPTSGDRGHEGSSVSRGFSDIAQNLIKISVITVVVVTLQFAFRLLRKRKAVVPASA